MIIKQNDLETIKDEMQRGLYNADEANIKIIECERARLIRTPISQQMRSALYKAVRDGRLGRIPKKNGRKECFYKIGFIDIAKEERGRDFREGQEALIMYSKACRNARLLQEKMKS